ncbi:MAG: hypothetical protein U0N43_05325, partial [Mediterraneibacter sp.]
MSAGAGRTGLSIGRTPVSEKEQLRCGFELARLQKQPIHQCGKTRCGGICDSSARTGGTGLSIGRTPVSEKEQLRCGFELARLTEAADTP